MMMLTLQSLILLKLKYKKKYNIYILLIFYPIWTLSRLIAYYIIQIYKTYKDSITWES